MGRKLGAKQNAKERRSLVEMTGEDGGEEGGKACDERARRNKEENLPTGERCVNAKGCVLIFIYAPVYLSEMQSARVGESLLGLLEDSDAIYARCRVLLYRSELRERLSRARRRASKRRQS